MFGLVFCWYMMKSKRSSNRKNNQKVKIIIAITYVHECDGFWLNFRQQSHIEFHFVQKWYNGISWNFIVTHGKTCVFIFRPIVLFVLEGYGLSLRIEEYNKKKQKLIKRHACHFFKLDTVDWMTAKIINFSKNNACGKIHWKDDYSVVILTH